MVKTGSDKPLPDCASGKHFRHPTNQVRNLAERAWSEKGSRDWEFSEFPPPRVRRGGQTGPSGVGASFRGKQKASDTEIPDTDIRPVSFPECDHTSRNISRTRGTHAPVSYGAWASPEICPSPPESHLASPKTPEMRQTVVWWSSNLPPKSRPALEALACRWAFTP